MKKSIYLFLISTFMLAGCGLIDSIKDLLNVTVPNTVEEAVAVLDRGISELSVASADWQDIMNKVIADLPDELQSTITNEVSNLLNRGIGAAGVEVRCNVDFLRIRMQQGLQRIKAKLLGTEIPPVEPQLCQVVPSAVDMSLAPNRRNKVEFFGYDFDMTDIEIVLVNNGSESVVSQHLDQPTHYHMTLNLGSSGIQLGSSSQRIILRWNGRNISTIAIIQPSPDICETKYDNFRPANISVQPVHATMPGKSRGDKEFNGNGPNMYCSVTLYNRGNRVDARIYVTAGETKSDWTYGKKEITTTIYTADPGYEIEAIVSSTFASYSYTDNDHALDAFAGSGPVQKFTFNGDGSGSDIGANTHVEVQFNQLRVQLKETGNCVSSAALRSLELEGALSTSLKQKMNRLPAMKFVAPAELKPLRGSDTTDN
jgi:hypothetical protein